MNDLQKRLQALETHHRRTDKPTPFFTGYVAEDRYYEAGASTVDYRNGINGAPEAGDCYSKADLAEMERHGYQVSVISVEYAPMSLEQKQYG